MGMSSRNLGILSLSALSVHRCFNLKIGSGEIFDNATKHLYPSICNVLAIFNERSM
jgi:hypothetical protein